MARLPLPILAMFLRNARAALAPVTTYTPALRFNDRRNSMYL